MLRVGVEDNGDPLVGELDAIQGVPSVELGWKVGFAPGSCCITHREPAR